ncbi:anthranilate synthase subunit II [Mycobacterium tuberculosis]|nr:anthranilate synthase subunit II [Mycobacterium tuberculosis]CKM73414.1 anthranilate synthase subunit II [Mycobacterium tuberculosis]
MRILVVDNYDSFVFNLVQYLGQLGIEAEVWRNDDHRLSDEAAVAGQFDGVLLSPGPGTPERAGASVSIVHACAAAHTPLLGVCLGHQAIGVAFGATVDRAPELLHGKTSSVFHTNVGVLQGLPDPFTATRYHSLTILPKSLPAVLRVTARTSSGVIMAVQHPGCRSTVSSSIRSRFSPRAGTAYWPTGSPAADGRKTTPWYVGWKTKCSPPSHRTSQLQPLARAKLLAEPQRDDAVPVDAGPRRRVLIDDPVVLGATGVDVGPFVEHPGPAQRAQSWFGVDPEHAG